MRKRSERFIGSCDRKSRGCCWLPAWLDPGDQLVSLPPCLLAFSAVHWLHSQAGSLQVVPPEAKSNWLTIFHLEKRDSSLGAVADKEGWVSQVPCPLLKQSLWLGSWECLTDQTWGEQLPSLEWGAWGLAPLDDMDWKRESKERRKENTRSVTRKWGQCWASEVSDIPMYS